MVTNDTPQGDVTAGLTVTLSVFDGSIWQPKSAAPPPSPASTASIA
ncbi:MAG: hypothetical protein IPO15_14795 [Anaerolineae bacterium]|nr:hypothetical protein [Anaerolineae bacterium]